MSDQQSTGTSTPEQSAAEVEASVAQSANESSEDTTESSGTEEVAEASNDELQDVVDSKTATAEQKEEARQELVKRLKLKVNGREIEEEIDFSDDDKLREILQKGYAADEKFQKASSLEKQMRQFAQLLQSDPIQALIAAGHNPDELAEKYMQQRIEEMQKSPEQLQLEKLQKEVEKERKAREQLEQEKLQAEQMRIQEEYSRQLDDEITSALSKSELPKSPYVVKRIAENLMIAIDQGNEDVTVSQILPIVEKQIKQEIRQMFEALPEEIVEKVLGTNVSEKLRKRRIQKAKKTPETASAIKATGESEIKAAKKEEVEKPKVAAKDFFKNF